MQLYFTGGKQRAVCVFPGLLQETLRHRRHRLCSAVQEVFEEQFNFCQQRVCATTRGFLFMPHLLPPPRLLLCAAAADAGCPLALEKSFIHIENQVIAQLGPLVQFTEAKVRNSPLSEQAAKRGPLHQHFINLPLTHCMKQIDLTIYV